MRSLTGVLADLCAEACESPTNGALRLRGVTVATGAHLRFDENDPPPENDTAGARLRDLEKERRRRGYARGVYITARWCGKGSSTGRAQSREAQGYISGACAR
eukprot:5622920-Pyramimonas_sp.AAC.1